MMIFGLLFLMPSTILAYDNYGSNQHSTDYNDLRNRNSEGNPTSNIIFNFEQLRRGQPPQIEMRDESPGLYMYRTPPTTTTMAPIYVPNIQEVPKNRAFENRAPFSLYTSMPALVPTEHDRQSTSVYPESNSNTTPMPLPPPAPKWSDFSEKFNKQPFPQQDSRKTFETPVVPEFDHAQRLQPQPTQAKDYLYYQKTPSLPEFNSYEGSQQQFIVPVENMNQVNHDFKWNSKPPARSLLHSTSDDHTHEYVSPNMNVEGSRDYQNTANRGSHKFRGSWDDLVTDSSWTYEPQKMSSTQAPMNQGKYPPPLATLTPWLDGFGK